MPKILYIAGWGRSGTTILDNLLGQVEGFVSTGELHNVWQRGLVDNRLCGCGLALQECATWQEVFARGFGGIEAVDVKAVIGSQREVHTRHARRLLRVEQKGAVLTTFPYAGYLKRLYDGITETTGCRVIVDSSKYPADAILAAGLPGYEVYVLHMVRDPRAVAFSWHRLKASPGKKKAKGMLTRVGMLRSTGVWVFYNAVIARYVRRAVPAGHYQLLHYERLATEPEAVVDELISFLAETPTHKPVFDANSVEMRSSHTASGNPVRFSSGNISIRLDDEWERTMPKWRQAFVSMLAAPMLHKAHYGWKPGHH
jgi:sulfotransferase family protein